MGCFTRFHLYVGSVIETGKNLFNFSGKEGREAYLLWSITVAALITVVEAFGLFPPVAAKLVQARDKLGFQQTNWAQFFQNSSHLAHALTWLFMTSATVRRMRSTGYSVYVLVPFFLMAFSVDINDVLDEVYHVNVTTGHYTVTTYLLNAIKYIGTIGYSVVFTAGIAILLFVIPEAEEVGHCTWPRVKSVVTHCISRSSPTRAARSTLSNLTFPNLGSSSPSPPSPPVS
jgi:uncharacterized membrane protein YhaH (DUF805 family)